jgi:hypothetical protein
VIVEGEVVEVVVDVDDDVVGSRDDDKAYRGEV